MEIEHNLTRAQYIRLSIHLIFKHWFPLTFIGIVLAQIVVYVLTGINVVPLLVAFVIATIAIIGLVVYMGLSSQNRNFFVPCKYVFNADGVSVTSPIGQSFFKWEYFAKWRRIAGYYLLYISMMAYYPVEISSIPDKEISSFESLLNSKIRPPTKNKLSGRMIIVLTFDVLISLWWLFVLYGSYLNDWSFLSHMPTALLIAFMFVPIALLLVIYSFLTSNMIFSSRRIALYILHWLTFIGMFAGTLYIFWN